MAQVRRENYLKLSPTPSKSSLQIGSLKRRTNHFALFLYQQRLIGSLPGLPIHNSGDARKYLSLWRVSTCLSNATNTWIPFKRWLVEKWIWATSHRLVSEHLSTPRCSKTILGEVAVCQWGTAAAATSAPKLFRSWMHAKMAKLPGCCLGHPLTAPNADGCSLYNHLLTFLFPYCFLLSIGLFPVHAVFRSQPSLQLPVCIVFESMSPDPCDLGISKVISNHLGCPRLKMNLLSSTFSVLKPLLSVFSVASPS